MSLAGLYHDGSSTLVCLRRMNYLRSTVSLSRPSTTYNRGIPLSSLIALLFIRDLLLRAVITWYGEFVVVWHLLFCLYDSVLVRCHCHC